MYHASRSSGPTHFTTEMSQMNSLMAMFGGRLVIVAAVDPSMYPVQILGAPKAVIYFVMGTILVAVVTAI